MNQVVTSPNAGRAKALVYQAGKLTKPHHGLYSLEGSNNSTEPNVLHQAVLMADGKLDEGLSYSSSVSDV